MFDVVTDELGNVCDFKLVYANAAMQAFVPTGGFASAFPAQDGIDAIVDEALA